jgi:hypothetical protein
MMNTMDPYLTNTSMVHYTVVWKVASAIVKLCKQCLVAMDAIVNIPHFPKGEDS